MVVCNTQTELLIILVLVVMLTRGGHALLFQGALSLFALFIKALCSLQYPALFEDKIKFYVPPFKNPLPIAVSVGGHST